ncbi:Transposon Tf2-6 polyprotein [Lucilia cuprina]|nr:Transposon Tf2-6 polyprotein [Lucilia cuprina]
MNFNTRNQTRRYIRQSEIESSNIESNNRKRNRNPDFDLNRSTIHTEPKQRKTYNMNTSGNPNSNGGTVSQITDLSGTIIAGAPGEAVVSNPAINVEGNDEGLAPGVRNLVVDEAMMVQRSLEDKVRKMVQDEMVDIKKNIGDLAKAVENLSRVVALNQTGSTPNNFPINNNHIRNVVNGHSADVYNNNSDLNTNVNAENTNMRIPDRYSSRTPNPSGFNSQFSANQTANCPSRKENNAGPGNQDIFDFRQIRIDKLGIVFDNKSISIDDVIFRLEHLRAHYNIPEREVVRDFHLLVSDSVKDWYWAFIGMHGMTEWPVLRLALLSQYQKPRSNFEVMRDLVERKQDNSETIDDYFHVMNKLRSKLTQPIPEYDMIKILKRNLNLNVARIVYPISVSSVEQLRIECNEAERNFPRKEFRNSMPTTRTSRQVNDLYYDDAEDNDGTNRPEIVDLEALHFGQQQQQKQPVICWNCKASGHVFMECPVEQRALFCYKCGKPNVTTPKCPFCQQKNMMNGGEPCSTQKLSESKKKGNIVAQNILNANDSKYIPQMRHYLPLEIRLQNYDRVKARIFGPKMVSERILKLRRKFKERKRIRRFVVDSVKRADINKNDPRVFVDVRIKGSLKKGLLDSGASVSILGKGCREFVEENEIHIYPMLTNVKTASGQQHSIIGKVKIFITYKEQQHEMLLYLCPELEQTLYLGIDFWRAFGLAPEVVGIDELDINKLQEDFSDSKREYRMKPHDLTVEQQANLDKVVKLFDTFEEKGLGLTSMEEHSIKLVEGAVPVKDRYYPISPAVQEITYAEIDNMLRLKVIELSDSPWSNRTTVVRKPGKNRLCLDARKLNNLTIKDAYPLQNIDGILSRIDETYFISSVDLKYAFWQIKLDDQSKQYTAFTVAGRPLYQFRVMPFGLCNAAQRLCRLMDKVIPQSLKDNVFIYLDDLLVISSTFEEHLRLLTEVANCLKEANLTIGLNKSQFCFRELKYLGFIVGGGMLKTDPGKVEAIKNIKLPKTTREVRSFLGTAGWYRRFIRDFATISAPLTDTLKKSKKFVMTPEAVDAFEKLKRALTSAPVLRHPNFAKRFYVQCDASDYGVGAVLFQLNEKEEEHPIAFYSQKLNSCQKNYSVTEKECLAAVLAIRKFRPYVEMMPFTVITDHASLKWLMTLKDLSGRLARWSLQLQAYDFEIKHRKGSDNVVADMLSRAPREMVVNEINKDEMLDFETTEFESETYRNLITEITENMEKLPDLKVIDGMVFKRTKYNQELGDEYKWKLWIPENITVAIVEKAHAPNNVAHGGIAKTLERVKRYFYWPKMTSQIKTYVSNCQICKETKPANRNLMPGIGEEVVTERPFQKLYIDFLGKYPRSKNGNCFIFIVVDHFSKFIFLKAMKEATTNNVIQFLVTEIFHKFGVPEVIHSDNGAQFVSKSFKDMIATYKINHIKTAFYAPQSNASERVNQSVLAAIRQYLDDDHRDWDLYLSEIECALRTSIHSATGVSPFFALFGFHMFSSGADYKLARKLSSLSDHEILNFDRKEKLEIIRENIKKNMHDAYEKSAKRYNQSARIVKFIPGQEVYRRNTLLSDFKKNINAKFCKKFIKCRILKPIGNNMYELESMCGKPIGVFHAKDIKV